MKYTSAAQDAQNWLTVNGDAAIVVDGNLPAWDEVSADFDDSGLLIGNGASIAVWKRFAYRSLYSRAQLGIAHPLTVDDIAVFNQLGTQNFEDVLRSLATTSAVLTVLGHNDAFVTARYASIRTALVEAVHSVHVPWSQVLRANSLVPMRAYLLRHKSVFSTNYDLLVYWAMAASGSRELKHQFLDYIWNGSPPTFDRLRTSLRPARAHNTRVFYIHGGLHLYRDQAGRTSKIVGYQGRLLDQFGTVVIPEYVSEGTWAQKLAKISQSEYLSYAYESFTAFEQSMVVFGHSLDHDSDGHLIQAMRKWGQRRIAISIVPADQASIKDAKLKYHRALPQATLRFFNSRTHPLRDPGIAMPAP